jgi:hypothetical protein
MISMSISVHTICTCNIRLLRLFHFFLCCFILPCHTASYCPGLSHGLFRLHSSLRLSLPPFTNICLVIPSICSCFSNLLTHFLCVRCGVICVCVRFSNCGDRLPGGVVGPLRGGARCLYEGHIYFERNMGAT